MLKWIGPFGLMRLTRSESIGWAAGSICSIYISERLLLFDPANSKT